MTSRARLIVLSISAPVIVFVIVGGFLGRVMAREDTYQHLKIFDDVVSLITSSYVEPVNVDKVMHGAMRGLADGLDPDSAYLSPQEVKQVESGAAASSRRRRPRSDAQYYLRVDRRARRFAGGKGRAADRRLRSRDRQRSRRARCPCGKACGRCAARPERRSSSPSFAATPPIRTWSSCAREALTPSDVTGRIAAPGVGYVRIAAIGPKTADQVKKEVGDLTKSGATKLIVDVRRTSGGALDDGLAVARLFVGQGHARDAREPRAPRRQTITAAAGDGAITVPAVLLIDTGTSGAAELFAAALVGESARRSDRRAHDRPRRLAEADQAAGRQRALAHHDALSHAGRRRRCTRRASSQPWWSTNRTSSSVSPRRRPMQRSTRRSSG